jgi:hypothetical protein
MCRQILVNTLSVTISNKNICEELIAYFPLVRHGLEKKQEN